MAKPKTRKIDIVVVGGGLAGLVATLTLASLCKDAGLSLALIAPQNEGKDGRTTALLMPSVELMERLNLWEILKPLSAPLTTMRMIDGTKRLIRAPVTDFKAAELDLEAFGYNVPNAPMAAILEQSIAHDKSVERIFDTCLSVDCLADRAIIETVSDETIEASMIIACDGKSSMCRDAAGIETNTWRYPQSAVVLNFTHTLPHHGISTEFHTETGPFTQVPLPPDENTPYRSSLVWVVRPEEADILLSRPLSDVENDIEGKMQSYLGQITIESALQAFPLSGMTARRFAANRVVLIGEAAHVFPPIGAQGLNLGLRDVMALEETLNLGLTRGEQPGSMIMMDSFHAARSRDVHLSTGAVDLLNRSLLADFLPVQAARAIGLLAVGQIGWLKKQVMKRGFGPA